MISTLRPSASARSFSKARVSASLSLRRRRLACCRPPPRLASPDALHQRLDRAHVEVLARRCAGRAARHRRGRPARGAWPAVSLPSCTSACTSAGSFSRRSVLARWLRLLPITSDELLLGVAEALDQLVVAGRLLDGVEVGALHVLDDGDLGASWSESSRTITGTCVQRRPSAPRASAARRRRSRSRRVAHRAGR